MKIVFVIFSESMNFSPIFCQKEEKSWLVFILKKIRSYCIVRIFLTKLGLKLIGCHVYHLRYDTCTNFIKSHEKCIEKKEKGNKKCRKMALKKLKEQSEQNFFISGLESKVNSPANFLGFKLIVSLVSYFKVKTL